MEELKKRDLAQGIKQFIKEGKPFLGICLGLQLLFSESEEGGRVKGLGILEGTVRKFKDKKGLKIPHMGWNKISVRCEASGVKALEGVLDGSYMYFVHSYYVEPADRDIVLCETEYGNTFTSSIHRDNIYAFQFHPEKSQAVGLKIIRNFAGL